MAEKATDEDLDLLEDLGVDTTPTSSTGRSAKEQRIIAGFEEIVRFVEEHGRTPQHGEGHDIFERLYAVRLDRIRESAECRDVLRSLDSHGLLGAEGEYAIAAKKEQELDDEDLLSSLGIDESAEQDVAKLVHVRSREEIRTAEEVAGRTPCQDFKQFERLFESVQNELQAGKRKTMKYRDYAAIKADDLFILDGQKVLVAEVGEEFVSAYERVDRRLRVVYDNGTESNLLLRSLQRALNKDKASRRITKPDFGPLFSDQEEEGDSDAVGYIYVLRSQSDHPFIAEHRNVIHKIGVTTTDVDVRSSQAKKDPTFLLAGVQKVATYKLVNVDCKGLETMLHRFFGRARLDLHLKDRFGGSVGPREWFLVPLPVIEETFDRIIDGTIGDYRYDVENACLVLVG